LRALAVTSTQPWPATPDLPTIAASGLPGYELTAMHGLLAPAKTPLAIIARLNREVVQHITQPDIKQKFLVSGSDVVAGTPQQFASTIVSDMGRMAKLIRDRNIQDE